MNADTYELFYDEGGTLRARRRHAGRSVRTDPRDWSEAALTRLIADVLDSSATQDGTAPDP